MVHICLLYLIFECLDDVCEVNLCWDKKVEVVEAIGWETKIFESPWCIRKTDLKQMRDTKVMNTDLMRVWMCLLIHLSRLSVKPLSCVFASNLDQCIC